MRPSSLAALLILASAILLSGYAILAPGGSNGQLQYNCNGSFCGDPAAPSPGSGNVTTANARGAVTAISSTAVIECLPADPTGVTNGNVMMGLACSFTPSAKVRALVIASGVNNSPVVAGNTETVAIRYGTGTAPANGAALTGTIAGKALDMEASNCSTTTTCWTFSRQGLMMALTPGTTYWIDLSWGNTATAAAAGPLEIVIDVIEL